MVILMTYIFSVSASSCRFRNVIINLNIDSLIIIDTSESAFKSIGFKQKSESIPTRHQRQRLLLLIVSKVNHDHRDYNKGTATAHSLRSRCCRRDVMNLIRFRRHSTSWRVDTSSYMLEHWAIRRTYFKLSSIKISEYAYRERTIKVCSLLDPSSYIMLRSSISSGGSEHILYLVVK